MKKFKSILLIFMFCLIAAPVMLKAAAPVPLNPVDEATCVSKDVTLAWEAVASTSATYSVVVSYNADCSDPLIESNEIDGLSFKAFLAYNTTYYWRPIATWGGVSEEGEIFSFTTHKAPPVIVAPDDDIECILGDLTFEWNSLDTLYCLQVSTTSDFASIYLDTCNITELGLTLSFDEYGQEYFWRVGAYENTETYNNGCMTGYSEPRSFTTPRLSPTPLLPLDGTLGINIFGTSMDELTLVWEDENDIDNYQVQIALDTNFTSLEENRMIATSAEFVQQITPDSTYQIENSRFYDFTNLVLEYNTNYYWRVRSVDSANCESEWSDYKTFVTPFAPIVLVNPRNDDACNSLDETFIWNQDNRVAKYHLQIFRDIGMLDTLLSQTGIRDTIITDVALDEPLHTYFWRVRSEDNNNTGFWSMIKNFTTTQIPPLPFTPKNGTSNIADSVLISWEQREGDTYQLTIAKDPNFTDVVLDSIDFLADEHKFYTDEYNTTYYWRLRAFNGICTSEWCETLSFSTAALAPPTPLSPADGEELVEFPCFLDWTDIDGATYYSIQVNDSLNFVKPTVYNSDNEASQSNILDREPYTTYYWRVQSRNTTDSSAWSEIFSFTMGGKSAYRPGLIAPSNESVKLSTSIDFEWDNVATADEYDIEVYSDEELSTLIFNNSIDLNSLTVEGFDFYSIYYWRVRSTNEMNKSEWSKVWNFRTIDAEYIEGPALVSPVNDATRVDPKTVKFEWEEQLRAAHYYMQVSKNEDFTDLIYDEMVFNRFQFLKLEFIQKYYWKVKTNNEAGYSPYSETYMFTTKEDPSGIEDDDVEANAPKLFPNPASENAILSFHTKKNGPVTVMIKSIRGKTVGTTYYSLSRGQHKVQLDVSNYGTGSYLYIIKSPGEKQTGKFIVK